MASAQQADSERRRPDRIAAPGLSTTTPHSPDRPRRAPCIRSTPSSASRPAPVGGGRADHGRAGALTSGSLSAPGDERRQGATIPQAADQTPNRRPRFQSPRPDQLQRLRGRGRSKKGRSTTCASRPTQAQLQGHLQPTGRRSCPRGCAKSTSSCARPLADERPGRPSGGRGTGPMRGVALGRQRGKGESPRAGPAYSSKARPARAAVRHPGHPPERSGGSNRPFVAAEVRAAV